jgi:hypothetical protein
VIVPRYGIEGRVRLPHLTALDENIKRDAEKHSISHKGTKIQVFDKVRVRISVKVLQETQKELMLDLIQPVFGGSELKDEISAPSKNATPTSAKRPPQIPGSEKKSGNKKKRKKTKK